jgi:hypothetical protein
MEQLFIAMELEEKGHVDPQVVAEDMARWERTREAARGGNQRPPDGAERGTSTRIIPPGLIVLFLLMSALATAWALGASVGAESEHPVPAARDQDRAAMPDPDGGCALECRAASKERPPVAVVRPPGPAPPCPLVTRSPGQGARCPPGHPPPSQGLQGRTAGDLAEPAVPGSEPASWKPQGQHDRQRAVEPRANGIDEATQNDVACLRGFGLRVRR